MLTGQLRAQIDRIWDAFWSGGISNPLEVIEQITYLLFLRRLDDLETLEENKAARLGEPMTRRFYPGSRACGRRAASTSASRRTCSGPSSSPSLQRRSLPRRGAASTSLGTRCASRGRSQHGETTDQ